MFYEFVLFLPASVCLLYSMFLFCRVQKNQPQTILMWLLFFIAFYNFSDAVYMLSSDSHYTNVLMDLIAAIPTPLVPFLGYMLLRSMFDSRPQHLLGLTVFGVLTVYATLLAVSVGFAGFYNIVSFQEALSASGHATNPFDGLSGLDALPRGFRDPIFLLYLILTRPVFYLLTLLGVIMVVTYIVYLLIQRRVRPGQLFRFLFKGQSITSFYLISSLLLLFALTGVFRICISIDVMRIPAVAITYSLFESLVLYAMGYVGLVLSVRRFSLKFLFQQLSFDSQTPKQHLQAYAPAKGESMEDANVSLPDDADRILAALKRLMDEDQLFLNPDVTIEDVASELNTNRVYISRIVNQMMHLTFREYVNQQRIRYSKQYMRKHPDFTQEAVATACGYQDAASFNRKFRQVTGMTPRAWMTKSPDNQENSNNEED